MTNGLHKRSQTLIKPPRRALRNWQPWLIKTYTIWQIVFIDLHTPMNNNYTAWFWGFPHLWRSKPSRIADKIYVGGAKVERKGTSRIIHRTVVQYIIHWAYTDTQDGYRGKTFSYLLAIFPFPLLLWYTCTLQKVFCYFVIWVSQLYLHLINNWGNQPNLVKTTVHFLQCITPFFHNFISK